jgi:hypothetical protein
MRWRDCFGPSVRRRWIGCGAAVVEKQHSQPGLLFVVEAVA